MEKQNSIENLISLPAGIVNHLSACEPRMAARCFAASDPPESQLGSGGGTAHLLAEAWRNSTVAGSFDDWLDSSQKIMIHGSGQSRRLPAYAAPSKLFIPIPAYRWELGHRIDQSLLDLQLPFLEDVYRVATNSSRLLIASGDVLLRNDKPLPQLPDADIVMLGLWTTPEEACNFGVMFTNHNDPTQLISFLQKPSPDRIRELAAEHIFMVDVGVWLLSKKAVKLLMQRSGWNPRSQQFSGDIASFYDLYGAWGPALGSTPAEPDNDISALTTAVVPIPGGEFYHFGKSRDIIESVYRLQNLVIDQSHLGSQGRQPHPKQFCQNTIFKPLLRQDANHTLWVENSYIPATWKIAHEHLITGVPKNDWNLELEPGVCLDFVPIDEDEFALRVYGIDDPSRGLLDSESTIWLGESAPKWFRARSLEKSLKDIGSRDIHDAPLFPCLKKEQITAGFIKWMFSATPENSEAHRNLWSSAQRLSAAELTRKVNIHRLYKNRQSLRNKILPLMAANYEKSIFYKLDLEATAAVYAESGETLPQPPVPPSNREPLLAVHDRMFRAAVMRRTGSNDYTRFESEAFELLHNVILAPVKANTVKPQLNVLDDQIVWGRSPVRLDIAGGWSDTPPYCLEHGGQVLNIAVNLNGQPPIQAFARKIEKPELVIRSIDLGLEEHLCSYEDVRQYANLDSGFTITRAAFALAGFDPEFNGGAFDSLKQQLEDFGCGIEITMLAAIPKGSGLGTSSILSATILATLSDFCGLHWDRFEICHRTLALEQMLTSGGGWQDQVGGLFHGIKLIETVPGIDQTPTMRWLPDHIFASSDKERILLYYTGITRVAHNILGDIVRSIFLNGRTQLSIIEKIKQTATDAYDAIQQGDFDAFANTVAASWQLNQQLDSGTNVEGVQKILDSCAEHLLSAKLLGAGGGGYLLMIAKSSGDARAIRELLTKTPPNPKARFVEISLSNSGLQVTRS